MERTPYELLPKEDWILNRHGDEHISAGIYRQSPNFIHMALVKLSDLPNDLITNDDLVRFGIDPA